MRQKRLTLAILLSAYVAFPTHAQPPDGKQTVPFASLEKRITAKVLQVDFPAADSNYHTLTAASDGRIYYALNTHNPDYAVRVYSFDTKTKAMHLVGKIDEVLGEDGAKQMVQGKIHTPLFENKGKLWFATHTSFYQEGLPGIETNGKLTYQGGHFMNYDLKTGRFEDLAKIFPNEGIITMSMDRENEILYGLTWPSALLVSYDIQKDDLRYWGSVQSQGEWGHQPWEWDRVCRYLAVGPEGKVYGSTIDGLIWRYDRTQNRRVSFIEGLDLSHLPFAQSAEATLKGDFQHNWRTIRWNPKTQSFWGLHFESTILFEFDPVTEYVRAHCEFRPKAYQGIPRNPEVSQLGFAIGPDNTIYYLAHGPAVEIDGRPSVQSGVYLLTYNIESGKFTDHGPVFTNDDRRVFFTESLEIGPEGHIYTVAWVEITDPDRIEMLQKERKAGAPAETEKMVYEIQLVQLPKWGEFAD